MTEDSDNTDSNEHNNEHTEEPNIDQNLYLDDSNHAFWTPSGPMAELPSEVFKKNLLPTNSRKFILQNELKNRNISFTPPDIYGQKGYQKQSEREEVFGEELPEIICKENEINKLFNDAAWQKRWANQFRSPRTQASNNFRNTFTNSSSYKGKYKNSSYQYYQHK
ncbi:hypothetical protein C1646_675635 [Rhizophagus diaphanus]|nr:hypothetical protein C1646_675635 [Rhizophagus diaphanus] [Rhizophagus sp. MUCL 43196]